ncbi:pyroglutamyl-peptidase 1 [Exaiptasia diaphana]|uniref:Pyroglutamyl-peptidase I n=1 Tax=Exaiptasia diaphana TaxID=2652724 RepID=A0A913XPH3_EXADI|nr:pyroglutamyl-peptidase 1 [Exaiptasia diaphana]KXJ10314.1 Pyroglutamyl-peptidase 1 [Exaiptasia diaphana]
MADREKPTVLVTGFGPFGPHKVNSSMVAVKGLVESDITNLIDLVTEELPVIYEYVQNEVPNLWKKHKPKLCIHVGVHGLTDKVLLETCAHNDGYQCKPDINFKVNSTDHCVQGAPELLHTPIDLKTIHKKAKEKGVPCEIALSDDPGRYLCDFTYFTSLHHGDSPTVFIHLPPIQGPYTCEEMAETLKIIILLILEQIQLL